MEEQIKVSIEPKSKGVDFQFENGFTYECGVDWFLNQENSDRWFDHLREKIWFTPKVENEVSALTGMKCSFARREW